jgi:transcriptional regulator with XRE-family HTH domain
MDKLTQYRKGLGLSQSAMADRLGVSRVTLHRWEAGRAWPDIESLVMVEDATGGFVRPSDWVKAWRKQQA